MDKTRDIIRLLELIKATPEEVTQVYKEFVKPTISTEHESLTKDYKKLVKYTRFLDSQIKLCLEDNERLRFNLNVYKQRLQELGQTITAEDWELRRRISKGEASDAV